MIALALSAWRSAAHAAEPQVVAAGEWASLFDGESFDGWTIKETAKDTKGPYWRVEDGCMVGDAVGKRLNDYVWLITEQEFADFELTLQMKMAGRGNSGIQVRSRYDDAELWLDGPQIEVHAIFPWKSGLVLDLTRSNRRWIYPSLPDFQMDDSHAPAHFVWHGDQENSEWNAFRIVCSGTRILTWVNDVLITDYDGAGVLDDAGHQALKVGMKGHIGWQLHKNQEMKVWVKDVRVRPVASVK